jgi:acyl carrier protein
MTPPVNVVADLEKFILDITQGTGVEAVAPDEDMLANGIIDSHGLMELVGFIEQRYRISVADEDLVPENFQSLEHIAAFVARKAA